MCNTRRVGLHPFVSGLLKNGEVDRSSQKDVHSFPQGLCPWRDFLGTIDARYVTENGEEEGGKGVVEVSLSLDP